jgi:hypothetical protein
MEAGMFTRTFACGVILLWADWLAAAHVEQRWFTILVNGKEAGQARLTITEQNDGAAYVAATASVKVPGLLSNYLFDIEAQEWWKEGQLIGLKSLCNSNGKRCELLATQNGANLRVKVNGIERGVRPEVWTSSFWKLADAKFHNKAVPILAADTGEERVAQLQYIGTERITVANLPVACFHFRLTGAGNPIDLWFDQHHRLVRQEFTESGHKTIIQLLSKR